MTGYRGLIVGALKAVSVTSPTSYTWFGARSPGLSAEATALMGHASAREYLLYNLQSQLYSDFYCAGSARRPLDQPSLAPAGGSAFVEGLSGANTGTFAREPGWTVVREDDGAIVVSRDGLSLWVPAAEVYRVGDASVAPGAAVGVLMPKELLRLSPGFYMALSEAEFPVDGSTALVRFYWNLRAEGATLLINLLTRALNQRELAFRLKVVSDPVRYSRCDAGVLYVLAEQYRAVVTAVSEVYLTMRTALKPSTPALTRELAPGLALAEDPSGSLTSFGMHRCRMLAEAIVLGADLGADDLGSRLATVEERFAREGIDLERPYLNPGSPDHYAFLRT
jgi:hypothetical protein